LPSGNSDTAVAFIGLTIAALLPMLFGSFFGARRWRLDVHLSELQSADLSPAIFSIVRPVSADTLSRCFEIAFALPYVLRRNHFRFSFLLSSRCNVGRQIRSAQRRLQAN
jgi:hypothetical protein